MIRDKNGKEVTYLKLVVDNTKGERPKFRPRLKKKSEGGENKIRGLAPDFTSTDEAELKDFLEPIIKNIKDKDLKDGDIAKFGHIYMCENGHLHFEEFMLFTSETDPNKLEVYLREAVIKLLQGDINNRPSDPNSPTVA